MRRTKMVLGLCLLAVFALVPAGVASAKSAGLKLDSEAGPPEVEGRLGETAYSVIEFAHSSGPASECDVVTTATLTANDEKTDRLSGVEPLSNVCEATGNKISETGEIKEVEVSAKKGKATLSGAITVTNGAGCKYEFSKLKLTGWAEGAPTTEFTQQVAFDGTTTVKLASGQSKVTCPVKKATESFLFAELDESFEPYSGNL